MDKDKILEIHDKIKNYPYREEYVNPNKFRKHYIKNWISFINAVYEYFGGDKNPMNRYYYHDFNGMLYNYLNYSEEISWHLDEDLMLIHQSILQNKQYISYLWIKGDNNRNKWHGTIYIAKVVDKIVMPNSNDKYE